MNVHVILAKWLVRRHGGPGSGVVVSDDPLDETSTLLLLLADGSNDEGDNAELEVMT